MWNLIPREICNYVLSRIKIIVKEVVEYLDDETTSDDDPNSSKFIPCYPSFLTMIIALIFGGINRITDRIHRTC